MAKLKITYEIGHTEEYQKIIERLPVLTTKDRMGRCKADEIREFLAGLTEAASKIHYYDEFQELGQLFAEIKDKYRRRCAAEHISLDIPFPLVDLDILRVRCKEYYLEVNEKKIAEIISGIEKAILKNMPG